MILVCGNNLLLIIGEVSGADAVIGVPNMTDAPPRNKTALDSSDPTKALIMNYPYFTYPVFGAIGLILGAFYYVVTMKMTAYAQETLDLDALLETTRLAGQRVMIQKGNACTFQYMIDKPSLEGVKGTIDCTGPDEQGLVTVSVEGKEVKVEEFQLCVVTKSAEEYEEIKYLAALRAAEVQSDFEERGASLAFLQKLYVSIGQVLVGQLVGAIVLLFITARFNAVVVFMEVMRQMTQGTEHLLYYQGRFCSKWARCFDLSSRPVFCGTCSIQLPNGVSEEQLMPKTFVDGNIFAGSSFTAIIYSASIGAACGLVMGIVVMRCIAGSKLRVTIFTSLGLAFLFAILGMAISPMQLTPFSPLSEEQCTAEDINPNLPGYQRVSTDCILAGAAKEIENSFESDARLSVTGCLVNMVFFLFESLSFLALSVRSRGPNAWAKFEVSLFLAYFNVVAIIMLTANALYTYTDYLRILGDWYGAVTYFGAVTLPAKFGDKFPFAVDQLWAYNRQNELGELVWYNFLIACPGLALISVIQLCAQVLGWVVREEVWIRTYRAVLIIDMLVIFTAYISFIFFSLSAVNLVHNFLSISLIPLQVQYLFAQLYAIQSDIVPIYADLPENPVLANFVKVAWLVPPLALIIFMLGLAFSSFFNLPDSPTGQMGVTLMAIGGAILFFNGFCVSIQIVRYAGQYAEDWQIMIYQEMGWELNKPKPDDDGDEEKNGKAKNEKEKDNDEAKSQAGEDETKAGEPDKV